MACTGYAKSVPVEGTERPSRPSWFCKVPRSRPTITRSAQARKLWRYRHRREIDEPALRLHKTLDPGAHGTRTDVMCDIKERRVVDILLEDLVDIPDHGIGVECRAIMERDAGTKLEGPLRLVGLVDLPFGRKAGMTTLALVADDRSHMVSESYIVTPVKRLPSNP